MDRPSVWRRWVTQKGDRVGEGTPYSQELFSSFQIGWRDSGVQESLDTLYYCADDKPPSRFSSCKFFLIYIPSFMRLIGNVAAVKELCMVEYGIEWFKLWLETSYKDPVTKKKWRDATFNLQFEPGSASITFSVYYKNQRVAYTRAKYADDSGWNTPHDRTTCRLCGLWK